MDFWKKISTKIKLIIAAIVSALGFVLFFFVREKIRAKDKMKYELAKVESELKIIHLESDSQEKKEKINKLKQEESLIREKIKYLENIEVKENREVSIEELDAFFDKRGF